jgi:hypothetical protein
LESRLFTPEKAIFPGFLMGLKMGVISCCRIRSLGLYIPVRARVMERHGIEEEVIVHPVDGMQLSEGYIRENDATHFRGCLPGMEPSEGDTVDEVLHRLEKKAKAYYGDDVVVEIVPGAKVD